MTNNPAGASKMACPGKGAESSVRVSSLQHCLKTGKDAAAETILAGKIGFEVFEAKFFSIDAAGDPTRLRSGTVASRAEQRMKIDAGQTTQTEENGVGGAGIDPPAGRGDPARRDSTGRRSKLMFSSYGLFVPSGLFL